MWGPRAAAPPAPYINPALLVPRVCCSKVCRFIVCGSKKHRARDIGCERGEGEKGYVDLGFKHLLYLCL